MSGTLPAGDVLVLAENTAAEQRKNGAYALFDAYYRKHMNAVCPDVTSSMVRDVRLHEAACQGRPI